MDTRALRWLVAIVVFSAIAFAIGGESWDKYFIPLLAFLGIFFVIQLRTRR